MDNRVFYGEYTLAHWIELLLNKQIVLPEYQRTFVWSESDVHRFIESLSKNYYIPPVTIGAYIDGATHKNLILDGQQRLTSILLAYLSLFPNKEAYKMSNNKFADANDGDDDDALDDGSEMIDWTMTRLLQIGSTRDQIHRSLPGNKYKNVNYNIPGDFFQNKYLGFSYIVQHGANSSQQKEYYSQVFRNINIRGIGLDPVESREALYFLDTDLTKLFKPDLVKNVYIKANKKTTQLDFVRILALMSQYYQNMATAKIARGYKTHMEDYYEEYLIAAVNDSHDSIFKQFSLIFPDNNFEGKLKGMHEACEKLGLNRKVYPSIIDADVDWFGLVYVILYLGKKLDINRVAELCESLSNEIAKLKESGSHKRTPGALKYLRQRIESSISVYSKFCV